MLTTEGTQQPPQSLQEQTFIGKTVEFLQERTEGNETKGVVYRTKCRKSTMLDTAC